MSKVCFKCGELKPLSEFYKHAQMADGHVNKCKTCNKADVNANREARQEYYSAYDRVRAEKPERKRAKKEYESSEYRKSITRETKKKSALKLSTRKAANTVVSNAVRDGRLLKQPCFLCGATNVEGHHPDYDAPLDVVWLCVPHHSEIHREYDREADRLVLETTKKGSRYDT